MSDLGPTTHPDLVELEAARTGEATAAVAEQVRLCDACGRIVSDLARVAVTLDPHAPPVPEAVEARILWIARTQAAATRRAARRPRWMGPAVRRGAAIAAGALLALGVLRVWTPWPTPISTWYAASGARATIGEDRVRVGLREPATLRDGDFVLRYAVAADTSPGGGVAVSAGVRGSAAVLVLHPVVRQGRPLAFGVDTIDWGTLAVEGGPRLLHVIAASPEGVPFVLSGRVVGGTAGVVRVTMADAGRRSVRALPVRAAPAGAADALSILLASRELETLTDDRDARRELALRYGLVSSETALVVVDATAPPR